MKNKNTNGKKEVKEYIDLLYMTPEEVRAKDIALILQDRKDIAAQLWEEMNILELELQSGNSVDFEPLEASFKAPSDAAFIKKHDIKTVFAINLCEADLSAVTSYFNKIIEKYSGFLCADSADFTPVYAGVI
jgi:predicted aminopeptidase